ncbi:hypothetical protein Goarm_011574 [Gossypium armourianum]|uniref:Uncharacterized protein n=1 Tax=Gossypium armourianum TaxID=34283 RepID=A0A7J9IX83_9ROSI|nr:hypothetical protein [Gossypium armourianum]
MIDGCPWMFNNLLMIYSRLSKGDDPLQVHDLLIDFLSESMAKQFENFLGTFVYYDSKSIMQGIKGFMRTSVCLDVRIPLKYHKKIHLTLDWWDLFTKAIHRRQLMARSVWLREEDSCVAFPCVPNKDNIVQGGPHATFDQLVAGLGWLMEENSIEMLDGKKRLRRRETFPSELNGLRMGTGETSQAIDRLATRRIARFDEDSVFGTF